MLSLQYLRYVMVIGCAVMLSDQKKSAACLLYHYLHNHIRLAATNPVYSL